MSQMHRTSTLWPLLGLACVPLIAWAAESNDMAGIAAANADVLPLCTPGLAKGDADRGALGLYDLGGGKLGADLADSESAKNCLKATSGNLSLDVGGIDLNLDGGVQYLGLDGSAQRTIRASTINPALCESYLTSPSTYALELRNSNDDIQGPSGLLRGVSSVRYQLSTRALAPQVMQAAYGPWLRCYDATLANATIPAGNPDSIMSGSFENLADLVVEYLDVSGAPIAGDEMVATIGSNSVYKVRVTNRGEVAATGVRVREFLPRAAGPLAPTVDAVGCVNETISQNCNVDASGALLQNIASIAPGASVTFAMTRKVNGSTPVPADIGALTSVAAFVDPNAVGDERDRDNSRHLRIGLVTNGVPVADPLSRTTVEDTAVGVTLTGSDPDGDALVAWTIATQPAHGDLSGTAPNLTYTPHRDYAGVDSFTYRVSDDEGGVSAPATVSITVTPVNDGPRIATQLGNVSYAEGADVEIDASAAFVDPEGNPYTVAATGLPPGVQYFAGLRAIAGQLGLSSSGSYTVTLTATETATGLTAVNQFTLLVSNTNQNPTVATPITDRTNDEGDAVSFSVAANFADSDPGDTLTFSVVSGTLPAGVSIASNGQISGTISQTAAGSYAITVRANDGQGGTIDDSFTWTVNAENAPPVAVGTLAGRTGSVGVPLEILGSELRAGFADPDNDNLTYTVTGLPSGLLYFPGSSNISGAPATGTAGAHVITMRATDPAGLFVEQQFTLTISP